MTADAKIGLLLGLVFIVIIAFLINGLPNFFKSEETNEQLAFDVPTPAVTPNVTIRDAFSNNTLYANGPLRPSTPPTEVDTTSVPTGPVRVATSPLASATTLKGCKREAEVVVAAERRTDRTTGAEADGPKLLRKHTKTSRRRRSRCERWEESHRTA